MAETTMKRCDCENKHNDKKFGKKLRIHNKCEKGWRCATCGKEKS